MARFYMHVMKEIGGITTMMRFHCRIVTAMASAVLILGTYVVGTQLLGATPQNSSDNTIVTDIEAKLFTDPALKTLNIHVAAHDGVVTLSGTVNTDVEKANVERFASQEPGVKQVIDNLTVSGQSPAATSTASSAAETAPAKFTVTVPAGTPITVQMIDAVDSAKNKPGDEFHADVYSPVVVANYVAIPQYANARLRLVNVASAGHIKGRSELALELVSLTVNGTLYEVESNYYEQQGKSRGKQTAERTAGGGALGALFGAIAGGGKGAGIGAAIGAATGVAVQEATKGQQVKVPSEAMVNFILKAPVTITSISAVGPPSAPPPIGLSGTWRAYVKGFSGPLQVNVQQTGSRLVGYVIGGDPSITAYIPAGKEVFYGTYSAGAFSAQEICAGWHYTNPSWHPVTFKVIDSDHLQEDLIGGGCSGFPIIWERAR